eukprot:11020065-Alexandrium_andersonii.AAC.1
MRFGTRPWKPSRASPPLRSKRRRGPARVGGGGTSGSPAKETEIPLCPSRARNPLACLGSKRTSCTRSQERPKWEARFTAASPWTFQDATLSVAP